MQDEFYITNGINHHHCNSLEEAYELGQFYATELQGEIRIFVNNTFYDKIAPQPKNESI
jgi:hypothetical protein